ncbi:hypothetical protein AgCh_023177 [Apium graveolens]
MEYVDLALMANSDENKTSSSSNRVITTDLSQLSKIECNEAINDMSNELYHLRVSLKSLAKENIRIKENNLFLSDRNAVLENQVIELEKIKIKCLTVESELEEAVKKVEILSKQLESEQEVIKVWKTSRDVSAQIVKEEKEHPLKAHQLKQASDSKKNNLNKKDGSTFKNFVKEGASTSKDASKVNIGHMTLDQLKNRLKLVEDKKETKRKSNRNGKVGINKHNNYTPDKYAPRKSCVYCKSVNHLSDNCKSVKNAPMPLTPSMPNMSMSPLHAMPVMSHQNPHAHFANMPYVNNPYFTAFSMPQMPYNMPMWNNMFAESMPYQIQSNVLNDSVTNPTLQQTTSETKVDPKGKRRNLWYLDSGCSRHMTGDFTLLTEFMERVGPSITFGDDSKGFTMGYGLISKENVIIDEVALVDGLKHNLLSISQLCDRGNTVSFNSEACVVTSKKDNKVVLTGVRKGNVYLDDFNSTDSESITCLLSKASPDESWLWHKKLSHLNFKTMNDLVKKDLVRGIPLVEFTRDGLCDACQKGKQKKASFSKKLESAIDEPLQLLHMDLFGPINDEASEIIINHIKQVNNHPDFKVRNIRSDNGTEFRNITMKLFCEENGIMHEFSAPRTPQQNGVVEKKNRSLIEAARTMLEESKLPTYFWAEAVNCACYNHNISLINQAKGMTPYQLFKRRKPTLNFLHVFGCKCYILRNQPDHKGKFDAKDDEGIFVGYSAGKSYRVYNLRNNIVIEDENDGEGTSKRIQNLPLDNTQNAASVESHNSASVDRSNTASVERQSASSVEVYNEASVDHNCLQVTGIPVVFISALEGRGRIAVMDQVIDTYGKWCLRLTTARLNRWLRKVMGRHSWKDSASQPKIKYFTQVKARPPTFVAFRIVVKNNAENSSNNKRIEYTGKIVERQMLSDKRVTIKPEESQVV